MIILIEISGGADSACALLYALKKYRNSVFYGIFYDHEQLSRNMEVEKAKKLCKRFGINLKIVVIKGLFNQGTIIGESIPSIDNIADIYTPQRNLVLLACSASYAESIHADVIVTGSKGLNDDNKPYTFRDSCVPFYRLMEGVLNYTFKNKHIEINPILTEGRNVKMSKKEVYKYLLENSIGWNDIWSCFNEGPLECGYCNNCIEKEKIKRELNIINNQSEKTYVL